MAIMTTGDPPMGAMAYLSFLFFFVSDTVSSWSDALSLSRFEEAHAGLLAEGLFSGWHDATT